MYSNRTEQAMRSSRIVINVALLIIFILYFGKNSMDKYFHGGVVISRDEEKTYNITPPGVNIFFTI